jgi:hypothetical protein
MIEGLQFFFWFFIAIMTIPALFIVLFDRD